MGVLLKIILLLSLSFFAFADIVKLEDGSCYEQRGKMNFVVPCPSKRSPEPEQRRSTQRQIEEQESGRCLFRLGMYQVEYLKPEGGRAEGVSCIDAQHYIDRINLGYDPSLKKNKKNIGKLIVKRALSHCRVEIYYGDFITIGLMSGDRLMCDDFMVDLPSIGRRR